MSLRHALALACLTATLGSAVAQERGLPDMGSSAADVLSPARQQQYGEMTLSQLRNYGYTLDDPLLSDWLQTIGSRLASNSQATRQPFTFFWLKDRQINAFATLGGYIGVNAGLMLTAQNEDELASVLAHEIAHVSQAHVLRGVERAQRDSVPILLAMLGAIAAAQASGARNSGEAMMAATAAAQGLMAQRQIDYTRSNEAEADRIGLRNLAAAGYATDGMARMFERMQTALRANRGGDRERTPDYLQTHPVTTDRIAQAQANAGRVAAPAPIMGARQTDNPLLPGGVVLDTRLLTGGDSGQFAWAQERLRVLSAPTPDAALREYAQMSARKPLTPTQQYGQAVAQLQASQPAKALALLQPLQAAHPGKLWVELAMAQAEQRSGDVTAADRRFGQLIAAMPRQPAVALTYAQALVERNTPAAGKRGQDILRPLQTQAGKDPVFQQTYGRLSEIAGDPVRAGEAYAEATYLRGRPEQALLQLNTLLKRPDLDYYARVRIEARIAAITPTVLDLRDQGVRDPVLDRDRRR